MSGRLFLDRKLTNRHRQRPQRYGLAPRRSFNLCVHDGRWSRTDQKPRFMFRHRGQCAKRVSLKCQTLCTKRCEHSRHRMAWMPQTRAIASQPERARDARTFPLPHLGQ
jgi:hypothetical protein